ncbi:MAG: hypothetical protein HY261_00975, partial [Chloroflexi bacterium]|nr:hypothetical protein [Chloroflexota bacterium]
MTTLPTELIHRFEAALEIVEPQFVGKRMADEDAEVESRAWLDGNAPPLPWMYADRLTADEWFFVTTLYGQMTLDGQRTHIRKYFPMLFVAAARRDIRNFVRGMPEFAGLRSGWMRDRLCRMADILRERSLSMSDYAADLRHQERAATPDDPMPALDAIIRDHRATGWKTLSVFVRDCVGGNAFPIDSRVEKELRRHDLPVDERQLVRLCLAVGRNPRVVARMFY